MYLLFVYSSTSFCQIRSSVLVGSYVVGMRVVGGMGGFAVGSSGSAGTSCVASGRSAGGGIVMILSWSTDRFTSPPFL